MLRIAENGLLALLIISIQHACGLSTTPTLLACADVTTHARVQCRKESSNHNNSTAILRVLQHRMQYYTTVAAERVGMCSREL